MDDLLAAAAATRLTLPRSDVKSCAHIYIAPALSLGCHTRTHTLN